MNLDQFPYIYNLLINLILGTSQVQFRSRRFILGTQQAKTEVQAKVHLLTRRYIHTLGRLHASHRCRQSKCQPANGFLLHDNVPFPLLVDAKLRRKSFYSRDGLIGL